MSEAEMTTLEQIHSAAKAEFLEKGFRTASLRNIVKTAGVTTGAFYGYYKSKEELFDALVGEQYNTLMERYQDAIRRSASRTPEQQRAAVGVDSGAFMTMMTEYACDHRDEFKLLICCSEGTQYENMIHEMVEIETQATREFVKVMEAAGAPEYKVDPYLEHMLFSGLFSAFFEIIVHDMPKEQALENVQELLAFYTAGWKKIMGL